MKKLTVRRNARELSIDVYIGKEPTPSQGRKYHTGAVHDLLSMIARTEIRPMHRALRQYLPFPPCKLS